MCAVRTILGQGLAPCLLAISLCLLPPRASRAAGEDTASNILLWNTRCVSEKGEVDFGRKKDWERVSPGAARPLCQRTWLWKTRGSPLSSAATAPVR